MEAILDALGSRANGEPRRDVLVVSDHGMAPFHSAVSLRNLLANAGIDVNLLGIRTTGPAANVYVNLQGREAAGTVTSAAYQALVAMSGPGRMTAAFRDSAPTTTSARTPETCSR